MTSDLLSAALDYAAIGWPVLALRPRDKRPATAHGLRDATTDAEVVRSWWARWPDANVGLATGHRFDVLDLDEGGTVGLDALDRVATDDGPAVGPMVLTASGLHWYMAPTGLGNRARFLAGCDWRGAGGYVVAPPSVHPSGHCYAWDPTHGPGTVLPEVPPWLLRLLDPPKATTPPSSAVTGAGSVYGRRALETEVGRLALVDIGCRNDELVRASFRLGQLVAGGELDARGVAGALLTVALRIGLTEQEAVPTIRSGLAGGTRTPRRAPAARR
ncbi:MAG: bifunctional DNA primase/polymerase [Iamia sp.]